LFHKLSSPCPFAQEKQIQRISSCLFHSAVSQDDLNIVSLNLTLLKQELTPLFHVEVHTSTHSYISLISFPLRC
jgi:hypothetical protein